jgi:PAS domain-containing protein
VTTEAVSRTPAGEAGFRLLAEHLPNLILLAFDPELLIWAATGTALRARGWTPGHFVGRTVPEVGRPADAAITEACCRAALRGECRRLDTSGKIDPSRLWSHTFVSLPDEGGVVIGGMVIAQDVTDRRRAEAERRRLLGRVYEAQEGQDRRLAADLHDGHVQSLAAIGFKLEQARLRLGASGSPEVDDLLWQVTKDLSTEVTSLRRTIGRLRPLVLVEDGLEAALRGRPSRPATGPPWSPAMSPRSWTGGWTRWWRRPCSGSPSRRWPTWSTTPTRPAPWSRSSAPATAWSCGSATTAAASTPSTCRCSPTSPTSA